MLRVFGGIHLLHAVEDGFAQGESIGARWVGYGLAAMTLALLKTLDDRSRKTERSEATYV